MSMEFKLPDLGEGIESGDVVSLLVSEGDTIEAEQPVVELETDKAILEVPCPHAGVIVKIHVAPGDTVEIGGLLVTLEPAAAPAVEERAESAPQAAAAPAEKPTQPKAPAPVAEAQPVREAPPAQESHAAAPTAAATDAAKPAAEASIAPAARPNVPEAVVKSAAPANDGRPNVAAGPATRRLARELGVDLSHVTGSGSSGRITRDDVMTAVREMTSRSPGAQPSGAPAAPPVQRDTRDTATSAADGKDDWGKVRREKMSRIRRTIAANMSGSWATIPHVTNFDEADTTELDAIRRESLQDYLGMNVKLTMMPFIMKAVAHALRGHTMVNASLDLASGEIVFKEYVNLGIAVDTERGLIVPVVRDADQLTIPQLALALSTVAEQARTGKFAVDDLRGGTFTISNMGAVGGMFSTPIINSPEVAVLLIGRSKRMPTVIEDRIEPRLIMPLSLSYDHRIVDGATAARFLNEVKGYLESPGRLLLAP